LPPSPFDVGTQAVGYDPGVLPHPSIAALCATLEVDTDEEEIEDAVKRRYKVTDAVAAAAVSIFAGAEDYSWLTDDPDQIWAILDLYAELLMQATVRETVLWIYNNAAAPEDDD
jgi:hypothetical protein